MSLRPVLILAGVAASALFLRPALADSPGMTANGAPRNGWALPVPPNGWGTLLPAGNSASMGNDHGNGDHGGGDHGGDGDHHHHHEPVIVTWPFPYYSGYSTPAAQPIVINVQAPQQPPPEPAGPPPPVPGIDTHPTVEETPSGIEIVRGPGSS
jgi:hypothetical protein